MADEDELVFLLHTAAEIEHMLLVQYLYAAYSALEVADRDLLLGIAREEMGHLLCIQNMLIALGGPLNFERQDYPFNELYPFPFTLRPLSLKSVATYVLAEMPDPLSIPPSLNFNHPQVELDAGLTPGEGAVNQVGSLFSLALQLAAGLSNDVIHPEWHAFQADPAQWLAAAHGLVLDRVTDMPTLRKLLTDIAAQGEGPLEEPDRPHSHFLRFYGLYLSVKAREQAGQAIAHEMPVDPTVFDEKAPGYIQHSTAAAWADIANQRLRWLFASLAHHLQTDIPKERNALRKWALEDMRALRDIAGVLKDLPQHDPPQLSSTGAVRVSAPPFALPYTLSLPKQASDLWRHHEMLARHEAKSLNKLVANYPLATVLIDQGTVRLTFIANL